MRTRIIPVLIFMLVFSGVTLLGISKGYAAPDLTDNECTAEEEGLGLCANAFGYIVQVYAVDDRGFPTKDIFIIEENGEKKYIWPETDTTNKTVTYRYRGFWPGDGTDCKGVDTWNFFVQKQKISVTDFFLMSDPPGASLLIPKDKITKCDLRAVEGESYLLKLNPALNCGEGHEVIFSFTYTEDVSTGRCNESVVVTNSGCDGGFLLGPSPGAIPFQVSQTHVTERGSVAVDFEQSPCGSDGDVVVESVAIDGTTDGVEKSTAWICTPYNPGDLDSADEYIYVVTLPGFGDMLCIKPDKAGLQNQGCVIDANPRTYLFGGDAYTRP